MAFQHGLSGLNASSRALDVIGNNIANGSTVGFKGSTAQFADVFAASLTGGGGGQIGIGTKLANVSQQFTQGNVTTTNNPLDVAINGRGFFRLSDGGAISYSRNGQFELDKEGYVVSSTGLRVTGYQADAATGAITGALGDVKLSQSDIAPKFTDAMALGANLDANALDLGGWVPPVAGPPATAPDGYNSSTSLSIYDSLGNSHIMTLYFVKTATAGQWEVNATIPDENGVITEVATGFPATIQFGPDGKLDAATLALMPINPVTIPFDTLFPTSGPDPLSFTAELSTMTQYGSPFSVNELTQTGYASGRIAGFSIGADGLIQGRYSNGQTKTLGQLALANFVNPQGLTAVGNNQWTESPESGQALVGVPGSGTLGVLQSAAVEDSNVDMTQELVNMIVAQRAYQANAQTIKTQDQVMQTLVNLR